MLDGYPLALEVVLANLTHQTPTEVLTALQAGDVSIDPKSDSLDKTESILRCIDYSHSNLSPEAQQLLLCLAPFTSVVYTRALDNYTNHLRKQPVLAPLPFERWPEVLQEAENWGLLSPDPARPRILRLQPIFPYFLRNRLYTSEWREMRKAVEAAYREHYDVVGEELFKWLVSKEPQERRAGQILTSLEYENLMTALHLALEAQLSIFGPFSALGKYLDSTQDQQRGLELGQTVLSCLEAYPADKLTGQLGIEFGIVIDEIAKRQLYLKRYSVAEVSYHKALSLFLQAKHIDEKLRGKLVAGTYHNLGIVADEQRQWDRAEQYYQQALQIYIEYDAHYEQARVYYDLGVMRTKQRQWRQAEQHYQQALEIYIEYNDRNNQARVYHDLGVVAKEQRQWRQAEQHYQQSLQIFIEYNDRYSQAGTNHDLGIIAYEQRQWEEAKQYCQQALQIFIEYNDRYSQAGTYHDLGSVAGEQLQWEQARDYFLQALEIYVEYKDTYRGAAALRNLTRLWKASGDANIPSAIATILGASVGETEKLLREMLEKE